MDKNFNLPTLQFPTKSEIEVMAKDYAERVVAIGNPLEVMIAMAATNEFFDKVKEQIKSKAIEMADELRGAKSRVEYQGATIQLKEPAAQYDWKSVPFIVEKEEELKKEFGFSEKLSEWLTDFGRSGQVLTLPWYMAFLIRRF